MLRLLQSKVAVAILGVIVYLGTTLAFLRPSELIPTPPAPAAQTSLPTPTSATVPSWEFLNADLDKLVEELKTEKIALDRREKELNDLARRLESERAEINQVTQQVYQLQREFEKTFSRIRDEETSNLKKLAKTYAAMTPENAANILKEMPDDQVFRIVSFMKESETAAILEAMAQMGKDETKRAARITDQLRTTLGRNPATAALP